MILGQVIDDMTATGKPVAGKKNDPMMPVAWTKTFTSESGKPARVFATTMGAASDMQSVGTRRLLVNATYWAVGLEDKIPAESDVSIVGEFTPHAFGNNKFTKGVKPSDLVGKMSVPTMAMTPLGDSGLMVSRIGLGLAALGRPGYINLGHSADLGGSLDVDAMKGRVFDVLDAAWTHGVRYFDAARSYGLAEEFLAAWLWSRAIGGSATIGSKWGYTYKAEWKVEAQTHEVKDHSLARFRWQAGETGQILGPWLSLYQIHSATLESGVLDDRAVLAALARWKQERGGKVGLSLTGSRQAATLEKARGVKVDGIRLFDTVQVTWNLLEPSIGPVLAEAHAAGLGVIVKEGLANGRLTSRNHAPDFAPSRSILQREADRLKTTLDALSLAAVLARPWVDVVLSGASTVDQLSSNLESLAVDWDEEAEVNLWAIIEAPEAYWATRSALAWN